MSTKFIIKFANYSKFLRNLSGFESLDRTLFPNRNVFARNCFSQFKYHRFHSTRLACEKKFCENKQSPILLGGLLTFLGIQKPEENEPELIMTIKKGILLIKRQQYEKAEQMLHSALKLAQDEKDEDGITYVYDVLANLAFQTKQYEKAEKLFVNILQRLMAKGEEKDSNKVIEISLKLAKIFEDNKDYKKAETGYKFCIESLEKKLEAEDMDTLALWGMSMDWYARFLLGLNKNSDALTCFQKAYEMCVKVNGIEHEQTVVLLNDLGTVSTLVGDHEKALSYLERAKEIGKKLPDMQDLSSIYINLGQLYLLKQMYRESKLACEEGLKMAKAQEDKVALSEAKHCLDKINDVLKKGLISKESKQAVQVLVS